MPTDPSVDSVVDDIRDRYRNAHGTTRHLDGRAGRDAASVTIALRHLKRAKTAIENLVRIGELPITRSLGELSQARGSIELAQQDIERVLEALCTLQEDSMADDKSKTGKPDRQRINIDEEYELQDWAQKFGVSRERLREAVQVVGPMADDVRRHLGK